jgi:hypothetical protein
MRTATMSALTEATIIVETGRSRAPGASSARTQTKDAFFVLESCFGKFVAALTGVPSRSKEPFDSRTTRISNDTLPLTVD